MGHRPLVGDSRGAVMRARDIILGALGMVLTIAVVWVWIVLLWAYIG